MLVFPSDVFSISVGMCILFAPVEINCPEVHRQMPGNDTCPIIENVYSPLFNG